MSDCGGLEVFGGVCGRYMQTSHSDYSSRLLWSCSKLEDHHSLGLRKKHLAESTYTLGHWNKIEWKRKREGDCDRQQENQKLNNRKWNIFIRKNERKKELCFVQVIAEVIPLLMNVDHQPPKILFQRLHSHRDLWTLLMHTASGCIEITLFCAIDPLITI